VQSDLRQELRCWRLSEVDRPVADRRVRAVKTVRIHHKRELAVSPDGAHLKKSKTEEALQNTSFYATNFQLGAIPSSCIHQLSRSR